MLELLRLLMIVGGVIVITFMVLLALPQRKLRDMLAGQSGPANRPCTYAGPSGLSGKTLNA
jgi:hypothetical protein